ncbi:MAG: FAD-dependent oxidoreductase [Candidatus Nanopelagicales bacterium]
MSHVITQACCNDASCIPVCPVGCIHPTPDEPGFATTEMLYIDPAVCIDCGACVPACPVNAIKPDAQLDPSMMRYREINAAHFAQTPIAASLGPVDYTPPPGAIGPDTLRVAIVGSGPAGAYAAQELLRYPNVEVDMFERLPTPWGLVRAGVAPDHPATKAVISIFEHTADDARFHFHLNVEIGVHLSHAELMAHHHCVIYAAGASSDRPLGVPGEHMPGSVAAAEFVNWYNGHPDFANREFDLSHPRVAVIGNGNVALDIARILVLDPDELATTDIAPAALDALRASNVEEVLVIGRRTPAEAACTTPELIALGSLSGVDVIVDPIEAAASATVSLTPSMHFKIELFKQYSQQVAGAANRRIRLRFLASPAEIVGTERVRGLRLERNQVQKSTDGELRVVGTDEYETLDVGLVIRAIGYRGRLIAELPFDDERGVLPNIDGRVVDGERTLSGVYATGWIKRGPTGVIGTNRQCAKATVSHVVSDYAAGLFSEPPLGRMELAALIADRQADALDLGGWRSIDRAEREAGRRTGAPRVKITDVDRMVRVARGAN